MNPFSSRAKCAARAALVLAVTAILLSATGCGSGSGSTGGGGGGNGDFSNTSLNGQFVIALTGIGVNQSLTATEPFSETIVLSADGNGHLSVKVDDFDQSGLSFFLQAPPLSGSYSINKNGTGLLLFNSSTYGITLIDDSHFSVIQGDTFATASGLGEKQSASPAEPSLTYVFKGHNLGISARVGNMNIAGGNINALEDFLTLGSVLPNSSPTTLTGTFVTAPDANGRGTFTLSDGSSFAYYVVSPTKFRFLFFSPASSTLEIGQAEKQSGEPFSNATLGANSYVFGSAGETIASAPFSAAGIHSAGVLTTDGAGKAGGTVDGEQDGIVNSGTVGTSGISILSTSVYSLDVNGRGTFDLDLSSGVSNHKVFWMLEPTRAYVLINNSGAIEDGSFTRQQGAPFSNSSLGSQAAFVMDGFDTAFKDRSGVITPNGTGTFAWNQQANSFDVILGGFPSSSTTNGTYQVSSNGRVTAAVSNVTNSVVFYLSSNNSGYMVQEDGSDIGGAFATQAAQ